MGMGGSQLVALLVNLSYFSFIHGLELIGINFETLEFSQT